MILTVRACRGSEAPGSLFGPSGLQSVATRRWDPRSYFANGGTPSIIFGPVGGFDPGYWSHWSMRTATDKGLGSYKGLTDPTWELILPAKPCIFRSDVVLGGLDTT